MKKFIPLILLILSGIYCAHISEAEKAFEQKDYEQTIRLCKLTLKNDSLNTKIMRLLSRAYVKTDSMILARNTAELALKVSPESERNIRNLCDIYMTSAKNAELNKNFDYVLVWYNKASELCPDNTKIVRKKADILLKLHYLDDSKQEYIKLKNAGKDSAGVTKILKKIEHEKNLSNSYYKKGLKYYKQNRLKSAEKAFKISFDIDKSNDNANYYYLLTSGRIELKFKKKKRIWNAIDFLGKASAIRQDKAEPHYYMAIAYEKKNREEFINAIDEYKKALELEPEGPLAKKCKAKIYTLSKRKKKLDDFWSRGRKKVKK
ncbi:hypothetical protein DRQ07_09875 [candidate division KSB1 bacterium]|nr:MAG: hypothetical protein DRQ07_09875 [candidate division KSB1 bacterium]